HAWFNPYRARHPSAKSRPTVDHISRTHPALVKTYGRHLWMDPGEREIREHSIKVVLDVVKRYDIDGVHIDDYFYPYKEKDRRGNVIDFPDGPSWRRYVRSGGRLSRDDWRRANVDSLVHQVYRGIKESKPWVKFGISPFGVWRPGYPPQICGLDSYSELYGDSRKWVNNGWGDYFTPQLYWPIDREDLSYPVLLRWWVEQNKTGRHIWPGNYSDKVGSGPTSWESREILDQIAATRAERGATGNVFFSMRSFMNGSTGLPERMASGPYAGEALVPASPWLDSVPPQMPTVRTGRDAGTGALTLSLQPQGTEPTWLWVIRSRTGTTWTTDIVPGLKRSYAFPVSATSPDAVVVTAVDRTGNESAPVIAGVGAAR
ncbi:MAG TPA: family 10 glycosylhydrolase, partial [Gemmatimonadaceae bacterium]|nr:family 10 glycosylhydrolase [Gemmatimonadaceae bacterium]